MNIPPDNFMEGTRLIMLTLRGKDGGKDGKMIFEGDILRILYADWGSQHLGTAKQKAMTFDEYKISISKIGIVEFNNGSFELNFHNYYDSIFEGEGGEKEVIGNIFSNPELIK